MTESQMPYLFPKREVTKLSRNHLPGIRLEVPQEASPLQSSDRQPSVPFIHRKVHEPFLFLKYDLVLEFSDHSEVTTRRHPRRVLHAQTRKKIQGTPHENLPIDRLGQNGLSEPFDAVHVIGVDFVRNEYWKMH